MSCTYCNNNFHTVLECEHPDSVPFYAEFALKLKKNAYDFWELYQILEPLTLGQLQMIMVSLNGPIDMDKSTLIACIIELNFEYETGMNDVTDKNAITCAVDRAFLLTKRTLKNTTEDEIEMCNKLLRIGVGKLITDTAEQFIPIIQEKIAVSSKLGFRGKATRQLDNYIKKAGFDLFYTKNGFNRVQRNLDDPEVWVNLEDTTDLLFARPLVH